MLFLKQGDDGIDAGGAALPAFPFALLLGAGHAEQQQRHDERRGDRQPQPGGEGASGRAQPAVPARGRRGRVVVAVRGRVGVDVGRRADAVPAAARNAQSHSAAAAVVAVGLSGPAVPAGGPLAFRDGRRGRRLHAGRPRRPPPPPAPRLPHAPLQPLPPAAPERPQGALLAAPLLLQHAGQLQGGQQL